MPETVSHYQVKRLFASIRKENGWGIMETYGHIATVIGYSENAVRSWAEGWRSMNVGVYALVKREFLTEDNVK